jgi:aryl sulfotransferase
MHKSKNIVWLASYPKSGNTWFRVFLSNLLEKTTQPADINYLYATPIASNRALFDEITGLSSADLTPEEIENLRPEVYLHAAQHTNELLFQKIHDAWLPTGSGVPLIPKEVTKCVIYFVRNPLDVSVSFSNHLAKPLEQTVKIMSDPNFAFSSKLDRLSIQLRQRLLSWSGHLHSWIDESGLPILVLRYEDIKDNPFEAFSKAVKFIGLEANDDEIQRAIEFSDIKEMQKQESEKGFNEKPMKASAFFRKGIAGGWRTELPENLVKLICTDHQEMMMRFGYLDNNGIPI